jgi:hypothetical protein
MFFITGRSDVETDACSYEPSFGASGYNLLQFEADFRASGGLFARTNPFIEPAAFIVLEGNRMQMLKYD